MYNFIWDRRRKKLDGVGISYTWIEIIKIIYLFLIFFLSCVLFKRLYYLFIF